MNLRFEKLSENRLEEALLLIKEAFPNYLQHVSKIYRVSISDEKSKREYLKSDRQLDYWLAIDNDSDKVVACTGFYQPTEYSKDEIWLGWYCVSKDFRGKGIGRQTLQWTIDEARKRGYTFFRLWTTTDPEEAIAQNLYDSLGIKIYKTELDKETGDTILYRELQLKTML